MELSELREQLCRLFSGNEDELEQILQTVADDRSVFPFNEYEHLIGQMLGLKKLTLMQYSEIRAAYVSENPNLWIYEISAPRGFGEGFAQTYVQGRCPQLQKPSKALDLAYSGEYDFWLDGVRIEVKASRAVDSDSDAPLYVKALARQTNRPFLMTFFRGNDDFAGVRSTLLRAVSGCQHLSQLFYSIPDESSLLRSPKVFKLAYFICVTKFFAETFDNILYTVQYLHLQTMLSIIYQIYSTSPRF